MLTNVETITHSEALTAILGLVRKHGLEVWQGLIISSTGEIIASMEAMSKEGLRNMLRYKCQSIIRGVDAYEVL